MPELERAGIEGEPDDLADFIKNRKAQAAGTKGRHPLPDEPEASAQSNTVAVPGFDVPQATIEFLIGRVPRLTPLTAE